MGANIKTNEIKYRRVDSENGYLTNEGEIRYYKQVQENDVLNNNLLGDFNELGNYVIKKSVIEELISVTKIMQYSYDKITFCTSLNKIKNYGNLEFAIKIVLNDPEKDQATAFLELLEPVNKVNGFYQNTNAVLIATYVDVADKTFLGKVCVAFNMKNKDDVKGGKKYQESIDDIIARKDYLEALKRISNSSMNKVEKEFYQKRISILMKSESGKEIIKILDLEIARLNNLFLNKRSASYYKVMNELLDRIIESKGKKILYNDKDLMDKLQSAQETYLQDMNNIRRKTLVIYENTMPTAEAKTIAKRQVQQQRDNEASIKPFVQAKNKDNILSKTKSNKKNKDSDITLNNVKLKRDNVELNKSNLSNIVDGLLSNNSGTTPFKEVDNIVSTLLEKEKEQENDVIVEEIKLVEIPKNQNVAKNIITNLANFVAENEQDVNQEEIIQVETKPAKKEINIFFGDEDKIENEN